MQEYVKAGNFRLTAGQVAAIDAAGEAGAQQGFGQYSSWAPAKPVGPGK